MGIRLNFSLVATGELHGLKRILSIFKTYMEDLFSKVSFYDF